MEPRQLAKLSKALPQGVLNWGQSSKSTTMRKESKRSRTKVPKVFPFTISNSDINYLSVIWLKPSDLSAQNFLIVRRYREVRLVLGEQPRVRLLQVLDCLGVARDVTGCRRLHGIISWRCWCQRWSWRRCRRSAWDRDGGRSWVTLLVVFRDDLLHKNVTQNVQDVDEADAQWRVDWGGRRCCGKLRRHAEQLPVSRMPQHF